MKSSLRPLISEKSLKRVEEDNEYTFLAESHVSKSEAKETVEAVFKVKVLDVRVSRRKGKAKRFGAKRNLVIGSGFKKVFVKLGAKEKIDLFETSKEGKKK